jgi:hypothetical protein
MGAELELWGHSTHIINVAFGHIWVSDRLQPWRGPVDPVPRLTLRQRPAGHRLALTV